MATISFQKITKQHDNGQIALSNLDLHVDQGEFLILVGPSGCGKTTALRMVAGLDSPTSGQLLIDGQVVNGASPRERDIAMMFQSYALYPHLTVAKNIGFGLRVRGVPAGEIDRKVREIAVTLELSDYLGRKTAQMSGGQRQRVAMARALVRSPKALLMDEPLSNLDARLRGQMRTEIAALQRRTGVTTLYVTHDQVEAMTMGTRVAVLNRGVLQQVGPPRALYDAPVNRFVAGFLGSPAMNFAEATVEHGGGDALALRLGPYRLALDETGLSRALALAGPPGSSVVIGLRPDAFRPVAASDPAALPFRVRHVEDLGSTAIAAVDLDGVKPLGPQGDDDEFGGARRPLELSVDARHRPRSGDVIHLAVDTSRLHVFDARTGIALNR